jgi:hypothetical protein
MSAITFKIAAQLLLAKHKDLEKDVQKRKLDCGELKNVRTGPEITKGGGAGQERSSVRIISSGTVYAHENNTLRKRTDQHHDYRIWTRLMGDMTTSIVIYLKRDRSNTIIHRKETEKRHIGQP